MTGSLALVNPGVVNSMLRLRTKPTAQLSYSFVPATSSGSSDCQTLVVFLNGLMEPRTNWEKTVLSLQRRRAKEDVPAMLLYDRYGLGRTKDRDPADEGKEPKDWHTCSDIARDLRQVIIQIAEIHMGVLEQDIDKNVRPVLVGTSIGCLIARSYAEQNQGTVVGFLMLDAFLSNPNHVDIFPDPQAAGFCATKLPEGITADMCAQTLDKAKRSLHNPILPNKERVNGATVHIELPFADRPKLLGPIDGTPIVTVVKHDDVVLAKQYRKGSPHCLVGDPLADDVQMNGYPEIMTKTYILPVWSAYFDGLARLTEPNLSKGPIVAKGCGHFIPIENPDMVAGELDNILGRISGKKECKI